MKRIKAEITDKRNWYLLLIGVLAVFCLTRCKPTYNLQGSHELTVSRVDKAGCGSVVWFVGFGGWQGLRLPTDTLEPGNVTTVYFAPKKRY